MLITRTPLRISIAGGGTDLPSYYERFGGFLISAAINKHIYIGVNKTFTPDYLLKYSALERVGTIDEIEHPILREALRLHQVEPAVEIVSLADIPAGTGLGSSGSFTVGLLRALHALKREHVSASDVAEEACFIEMSLLHQPIGKQDQYIAAYGGLTCFEFEPDGNVRVEALRISNGTLCELEDHLLIFFTGYSRSSETMLQDQKKRTEGNDAAMIDNLHFVKELALQTKEALESGDTAKYGAIMHEHWLHKRKRTKGMSNESIDRWYEAGRANGALGGKLIGAGGGGFLMFFAEDRNRLRRAMREAGLEEVRFQFDHEGSTVTVRDGTAPVPAFSGYPRVMVAGKRA
jgi:D-glycero-alpha-D-manno-heptose-7-phosphate kinase